MSSIKSILLAVLKIAGCCSIAYGIINIIHALGMPESAGLGAIGKQGSGAIYVVLGIIILLISFLLKKKNTY